MRRNAKDGKVHRINHANLARYFAGWCGLMPDLMLSQLRRFFILGLVLIAGIASRARADDWCVIQGPKEVTVNQPFDVTVQLKDVKEKTKLAVDIYWKKPDGNFGGFLIYGPRHDVEHPSMETFSFTVPPHEKMASVYAGAFLAPDGDFEHKTAEMDGPVMAIAGYQKPQKPEGVTYSKSWLSMRPPRGPFHSNEHYDVTVDYYLDSSEAWGNGTTISLDLLGPWIDCPDNKYTTQRQHISFPGTTFMELPVAPGKGSVTFHAKIDQLYPRTSVLLAATFHDSNGESWPWNETLAGPEMVYTQPNYELHTGQPGNLFTYDEPVKVQVAFRDGAVAGQNKTLKYTLVDVHGRETPGQVDFVSGTPGTSAEITLPLAERGTFLVEAEVEGWGKRELFLARIPDVAKATGGKPTPFAATNLDTEIESKIAAKLGFSACRHFVPWKSVQPGPDVWTFDEWDQVFQWNRENGIKPWVCLGDPPAWVQGDKPENIGYEPYPFDEAAWKNSARAMSEHWKNAILGWEWQNEIVPGSRVPNPVQNYLNFCRIGTTEAKAVLSPVPNEILSGRPPTLGGTGLVQLSKLLILQAGGLWPRNFRQDLLAAGVGAYLDVLPVHYSDLNGVVDARDDLDRQGLKNIRVWDDETGNGLSTWNLPSRDILQVTSQSQWALTRWPDELIGGAERITAFAGPADAAGNWSYIVDKETPRPYATTIAVLISKLATAKPLGKFFRTDGAQGSGVFQLFERDGKGVLVAGSSGTDAVDVALNVGANAIAVTDYQGNETTLRPDAQGKIALHLEPMPVFLEGGDLDVLKTELELSLGNAARPTPIPSLVVLQGATASVPVNVSNPSDQPMQAKVSIITADGQTPLGSKTVTLAPAEKTMLNISVTPPANMTGAQRVMARLEQTQGKALPTVEKPFTLNFIELSMLGNLVVNGGFEAADDRTPSGAASWHSGNGVTRVSSEGGLGLGDWMIRMQRPKDYMNVYQEISPTPGESYLYSAWILSHGMENAGSNLTLSFKNRPEERLFTPKVFDVGGNTPSWRLVSMRIDTPDDLTSISLTPIAKGDGYALFDNVRLSIYQGTNFAAEAHKVDKPPVLNGSLDGWNKECPIPLLSDNQLTVFDPTYVWKPEKLSGVAYLEWDNDALYFAADVIDDQNDAPFTDDRTPESDSIVLAIDPSNRTKGRENEAYEYYLSAASPGGGSGKFTLYRPATHAGGLPAGQLARDSSVYDMLVKRDGNHTIYQARLPWSQLGAISPVAGTQFSLSLQLNDNNGHGRAACMTWGDGIQPAWDPAHFGVTTLVP
jgi:hypothetical protein